MTQSLSDTASAGAQTQRRGAQPESLSATRSRQKGTGGLRKGFGLVHLYLSIPFGLILTLMCLSGALLVFEKEIDRLVRPELYRVEQVGAQRLPLDRLVQTVAATLPDSVRVTGVSLQADPAATVKVNLSQPRHAAVAVDPYTGEIQGRTDRTPFFMTVFRLHRWLLGSPMGADGGLGWGRLITGTSTLVFVFVLLSGLAVWWPRNRQGLRAALKLRWAKKPFARYYQLHRALGFYTLLFLLVMALTGLMWSFRWYNSAVYALLGVKQEMRGAKGGEGKGKAAHGNKDGLSAHGDGATKRRGGRPQGAGRPDKPAEAKAGKADGKPGKADGMSGKADGAADKAQADFSRWEQVADELARRYPAYRTLTVQDGKASVSLGGYGNSRAADNFEFDPATARITQSSPYAEAKPAAKVRGWQYSLHVGSWGGLTTRILYCLAALLGATLPLTGYYIWWKKRRR